MKFALHLSMLSQNWTDDLSDSFAQLKDFGFDGVELSFFGVEKSHIVKTAKKLKSKNLAVTCGTGLTAETDISSADRTVRESGIEYLVKTLDTVQEIGGEFLNGVLYAPWGTFARDQRADRWDRSADSLNRVMSRAGDIGINLEVLNRFETDFFNTLDQGAHFLSLLESQNVKLLADTFHMNIEEDNPISVITRQIQNIGCFHLSDNHRGVPGSGHIDFESLIKALANLNYQGYLTIESFVQANTEVADALFIWRELALDPLSEAEKGLSYIKNLQKGLR